MRVFVLIFRAALFTMLLFFLYAQSVDQVHSQSGFYCSDPTLNDGAEEFRCYAFNCYNNLTHRYEYNIHECAIDRIETGRPPTLECNVSSISCLRCHTSELHENTNPVPSWPSECGSLPTGCGQGNYGANMPTCSGETGGGPSGGYCSCPIQCSAQSPECTALADGASCPAAYLGDACSGVPCGYRDECGCSTCLDGCDAQCTPDCTVGCEVGGGALPTPTPMPSCNLVCPGTSLSVLNGGTVSGDNQAIGDLGGATVLGSSTLLAQSTGEGTTEACYNLTTISGTGAEDSATFGYGIIEGNVTFYGYNGFACSAFAQCPEGSSIPCPVPTIIQSTSNDNASLPTRSQDSYYASRSTRNEPFAARVLGAASDNALIKKTPLSKVLADVSQRLLAQTSEGTTNPYYSSTWTHAVTLNQLDGSKPKLYGYTVSNATGQSCSCYAALGCQESQQPSPNSAEMESGECESQCIFTIDETTEYPVHPGAIILNIDANDGFDRFVEIDLGDGKPVQNPAGPFPYELNYPYVNAGVYDIKLTCRNAGGNSKTCNRRLNVYCEGTDPLALPTPTPTPPASWTKIKDGSYHSKLSIGNIVPADAEPYDLTDTGLCDPAAPGSIGCFIIGKGGAVSAKGIVDIGNRLSYPDWLRADSTYSLNSILTPAGFLEYAQARKEMHIMSAFTPAEVQPNAINYYNSSAVIASNALPDILPEGSGTVIILGGSLTISMPASESFTFNPDNKALAFVVNGQLALSSTTTELNGIFVANSVDYAYETTSISTVPLKINGNISIADPILRKCIDDRQRDDNELMPSCYVTFDFENQFLPLTHLLSTRTYEWTELVP